MPTVLIVDDFEENLDLLESVLREQHYKVVKARNGLEALETARRSPPDLIVCDTLMPVMDGFTLCWRWRTDDRLRNVPFVIHGTPCADLHDERLAVRMGADRYFPRPIEPQVILERIAELLAQPRPVRPKKAPELIPPGNPVNLREYDVALIRRLEIRLGELELGHSSLRARNEFQQSLLNQIPDALLTFNEEGNVDFANQACRKMFGHAPDELVGQPLDAILPRNVQEHAVGAVPQRPWAAGMTDDTHVRRKDGSRLPVRVSVGEVRCSGRRMLVAHVHDLSERERLEQQVHQAQKMDALGRLCGGVAHDFNNMLTIISGYAQLLLQGLESGDPMHGLALEIDHAVERAAELTRQLLLFSRKQVKQATLVDLNSLVRGMERMLKRVIGEDIELSTQLAADVVAVRSDPAQLEQVILNLSVNARDAMPRGGRLILETSNVELDEDYARRHTDCTPGTHAQLAVTDTGTGLSDQALTHLFEPFFTTKDAGKGTGLGLATVYSIVKQWNGHVSVYSEPGRGTVVKVLLPRQAGAIAEAPAPPVSDELPGGSETVLLAEDDPDLRQLIAKILTRVGYEVLTASTGAEALRVARESKRRFDILITDVVMPNVGGPDLAEQLVRTIPGLRVLFISGYTGESILSRGLMGEGLAFLPKPFTASALATQVRELLDARPRK